MHPSKYNIPSLPAPKRVHGIDSDTFKQPPVDGSMFIPEMYDWHATHSPEHPLFVYPDANDELKTIKWAEATRAIHRAGRRLLSLVEQTATSSQATNQKPLIAILANTDTITYYTIISGGLRSGCPIFPLSIRNSPAALAHLLTTTQPKPTHLLVSSEKSYQDLALAALRTMEEAGISPPHLSSMPVFSDFYEDSSVDAEPLPPFVAEPNDLALIMHSSGSTAYPKPIPQNCLRMLCIGRTACFAELDLAGMKFASHVLPMYHATGIFQISFTAVTGCIISTFPPRSPPMVPTPEATMKATVATGADAILAVPSMISEWANDPELFDGLKTVKRLHWSGGSLAKDVGDKLVAAGVLLASVYGMTEFGSLSWWLYNGFNDESEYFRWSPEIEVELVPISDGLFQLVIPTVGSQFPCVQNTEVNGRKGYDTNDIFAPHPTKPGLWRVYGRADDQIMHSTGEKTNPGPLERILDQDPHVHACVMFGRGRFNAGVLIDPKPLFAFDPRNKDELKRFRDMIWPTVENMNAYAPKHSRVFKEMIIVSTLEKPFTYTGKITPRRQAIINDYEEEINATYSSLEESTQMELTPPSSWTAESTLCFLRGVVHQIMEVSVLDDVDIFRNGCDSLQATWIRNTLINALKVSSNVNIKSLPSNIVYQHPSISALASSLFSSISGGGQQHISNDVSFASAQAMIDMAEKYSQDFPLHRPRSTQQSLQKVYVITGTTGSLGCALLACLRDIPDVKAIYAINRKGKCALEDRQKMELDHRGYDVNRIVGSGKLILLEAATEDEKLGLPDNLYEEIRNNATHIIHNAWPVNFNLSLESFEPSIRSVRRIIDLSLSSPHLVPPRILFTSSISVLRNVDRSKPVTEGPVDPAVAVGAGYGQSKWVAERLLEVASRQSAVPTVSVRIGQLTGTESNGAWNHSDWLPSLVKSSIYMKCMPLMDKQISWISVDAAARALVDMTDSDASFLHLVHPRPVTWSSIMEPLAKSLGLPVVSFDEWVTRLEKSGEGLGAEQEVEVMRLNPALKIFDTFVQGNAVSTALHSNEAMGLPQLDVTQAVKVSTSLAPERLSRLTAQDALRWIDYWKGIGYLRQCVET